MKAKLAEALLRRKELNDKVQQIRAVKERDLFEVKAERRSVTDSVDDIVAKVPKLALSEVTAEYDHYARALRLCDAAIQQANWTTEVDLNDLVMKDYEKK